MTLQFDDEQPVFIRFRDRDGEKEYEGGPWTIFLGTSRALLGNVAVLIR